MQGLYKLINFIALAIIIVGCGHKKIATDDNVAEKKGVLSMWASWVKPKGKKYDMNFHIRNLSSKAIIVKFADVNCYRGAHTGTVKYTFFNTGERTIDMAPGQEKAANMVCSFGGETKGDFKVVIHRVFENPTNDGKTAGKLIGNEISWEQKDVE